MPNFLYTAKNQKGETKAGKLQATNEHELAAALRQEGLILVSAEADDDEKKFGLDIKKIIIRLGHISLVEKMMFTRHLAVMIKAGLSLNQALKTLIEQTKNPRFKRAIVKIEENIRQGKTFSESLALYSRIFNDLYINMVKVGETSGNLDEVLNNLAEQMRKDHDLISRIRGAMIYPAVIIITMIGIGILMMIMVVPKLTEVFEELNVGLPLSTRVIIAISNFLQNHLIWGLVILTAFIFLARLSLRNKSVKRALHRVYLHTPILGPLLKKINSARFARTIGSLTESGVAIVKSLEITAGTLGNIHFKESLIACGQEVQKGKDLSRSLSNYKNLYTPMVIQMVGVGEQTGNLSSILKTLAEFYEEEIDKTTKNLSSIIEPIIMIVVGAAIGFFAISMIQPMYSMMGGL